jgi:hypothetical protein
MIRDILLTAGVVLAAAIVLGIGIGLGRYSRRDEIDALDYRIRQHENTIGARVAELAATEQTLAEVRGDLARELAVAAYLRAQLSERRIGAKPIWAQLRAVQPPPIPDEWLRWTGSAAGQTGAWRKVPQPIPDDIAGHVELFDARTRPTRPVDTSLSDTGTFTIAEQADALDTAIDRWTDSRREVIELGEDAVVTQAAPARRGGSLVPVKDYPAPKQRHGHGKRGKR